MCVCVCVRGRQLVASVCVSVRFEILLFHLLTQHQTLTGNSIACSLHLCFSFSPACSPITDVDGGLPPGCSYSVPGSSFSVSPGLIDWSLHNGYNTCPREHLASSGNESALNRNIAAILSSFHSLLIILLVRPIQEWPDKSATQ